MGEGSFGTVRVTHLATARAPMFHAREHFDRIDDQAAPRIAPEIRHETDTAAVLLVRRVVEACCLGRLIATERCGNGIGIRSRSGRGTAHFLEGRKHDAVAEGAPRPRVTVTHAGAENGGVCAGGAGYREAVDERQLVNFDAPQR